MFTPYFLSLGGTCHTTHTHMTVGRFKAALIQLNNMNLKCMQMSLKKYYSSFCLRRALFLGETFSCHINLHNESQVECKNVVLKVSVFSTVCFIGSVNNKDFFKRTWGQVCRGNELWEVVGYMDLRHFASKSISKDFTANALTISVGSLFQHITAPTLEAC